MPDPLAARQFLDHHSGPLEPSSCCSGWTVSLLVAHPLCQGPGNGERSSLVWSAFGPREEQIRRETMRAAERQNCRSDAISGDTPRQPKPHDSDYGSGGWVFESPRAR